MNLWSPFDSLRRRLRLSRWTPERALAVTGEDLAMRYLIRQKFTIVARNYRPRSGYGEVDLIGWEAGTLAFIEVKTRSSDETGSPDRAIHRHKQRVLARSAREYASRAGHNFEDIRFDVLTVLAGSPPKIELFRDAFRPLYSGGMA